MKSTSPIPITILAMAFSCSLAIAIPESEPNDDIASADLADIANSITGSIQSGGDTDFFEIEDFGACPMRISASAEITTGSDIGTTDFELKLWDSNGNLLSDSTITSATQRTATVFHASPVLGPTFLSISRSSGAPFGSYQIDVQKNIVIPPRPKVRILTIKKRSAGRAKLRILASSGSARHYLDSVWVVAPGNSPASISLEPTSAGSNRSIIGTPTRNISKYSKRIRFEYQIKSKRSRSSVKFRIQNACGKRIRIRKRIDLGR